jgi:uncharacterized membrane protein YeaQ/YmgE (transglycosylase-associated protein family)
MDTVLSIWNTIVATVQANPSLAYFLGIGLVAGWLAGFLLGGGGLLRNLVVGVIGSFLGAFLAPYIPYQLPLPDYLMPLANATIGAILVVIIARIIAR